MQCQEEINKVIPELVRGFPTDEGADAFYWHQDGANWGVKFYHDENTRNINYERQDEAHHMGIAPSLGNKVDCVVDGVLMYGFITTHIRVAYYLPYEYAEEKRKELIAKISAFDADTQRKLRNDLHMMNWGLDENEEPLVLDFSRQSREDYSDYDDYNFGNSST